MDLVYNSITKKGSSIALVYGHGGAFLFCKIIVDKYLLVMYIDVNIN